MAARAAGKKPAAVTSRAAAKSYNSDARDDRWRATPIATSASAMKMAEGRSARGSDVVPLLVSFGGSKREPFFSSPAQLRYRANAAVRRAAFS
jgi:hypothetical protein